MIEEPREHASPSIKIPRPRPRFGLKLVFVLMTVACLVLGWRAVRRQRAAEILDRDHAVRDLLERNLSLVPPSSRYVQSDQLRQSSSSFRQRTRPNRQRNIELVSSMTSPRPFSAVESYRESLILSDLRRNSPSTNSAALVQHYVKGLASLGLKETSITGGAQATSIWQDDEHGIHVLIDVEVHTDSSTADVRIILLHNEQVSLW